MSSLLAFTLLLSLSPQGGAFPTSFRNIKIAEPAGGFAPCEPSIAISPKDPKNMVVGTILDRAFFTKDGGVTWTERKLTSSMGVYGDPTIVADLNGHFYYFHLSYGKPPDGWLDRIVCQKSTDGGDTWSDGVGIGHNPPKHQDKQWATTHPTKPSVYTTWTQFDKYGSRDPNMHSNIMFSMSEDGGITFSEAIRLNSIAGDCLDDDNTTEGAVPAVGRDGKIYVVWSNRGYLYFDRSTDNGKTWMPTDQPIAKQHGGWNMNIPGISRCNGMPVLVIDNSQRATKNSLYVVFADQRNGEDDTDILFIKSRDGGKTWTEPLTVNQDKSGKHQFFPWIAIDQTTGYIYIVYYDRRAYADTQTDVYLAYSTDGGTSFKERKISESPFVPTNTRFFGDYNNISAHAGIIAPVWTRMDDAVTTVWATVIRHADLVRPSR